ncbi:MAG TPA: S8 family serine peptidase [Arthrobacter sp.]|nr:S8 family serine peptidase [Arthrobacter sp.]
MRAFSRAGGRFLAASAAISLAATAAGGTAYAQPSDTSTSVPERQAIDTSNFVDGATYIVTLAQDAASSYEGGVSGIPATAPGNGKQLNANSHAVKQYQAHLKKQQKEIAAEVEVEPARNYTLTVNAFAAEMTALQAKKLAADKNVISVEKNQLHKIQQSTTDFLGLGSDADGTGGVWEKVGGPDEAGKGIVVGIIDTGIAPENPSFAGEDLSEEVSADTPYLNGETITFNRADGGTFTGTCQAGVQFTADDCSTKLIGAKYFVQGFGAANIGTPITDGEYGSPRDGHGHGSHTASTAAGNFGVEADLDGIDMGTISGVAPAAKIAAYKACWTGNNPGVTTDDGCATTDLLAAIEAATNDGVDVINYSIGGGAAQSTVSPIDQAFLGAAQAGIFVAASAGNSGPGASTLDNASPWITTVGNSTYNTPQSTVVLGDGTNLTGASLSISDAGLDEAPLILAEEAALEGHPDAQICASGSLDPEAVAGKIVVCDRGEIALIEKATEVANAGGAGMVLVNKPGESSSVFALQYPVPTVHLTAEHRDEVRAYAATEGASASMIRDAVNPMVIPAPQIAESSSRGPVLADGSNILKPDVTAPGTGILAAGANAEGEDPQQVLMSGTSMASPHVAGLAALYLGEQPDASPAEVKSALMTTAYNLVDGSGEPVKDVFTQGAGHVDPNRYLQPGMYFPAGSDDWFGYIQGLGYDLGADVPDVEGSELNQPSIAIGSMAGPRTVSRTVVSTEAGTYTANANMPGFEVTVSPSTLTFDKAGESRTFDVTFKRSNAEMDTFSDGYLTWTSGKGNTVRMPLAASPASMLAPASVSGEGTEGSIDMTVTPGLDGDMAVNTLGLAKGHLFTPEEGHFVNGFLGAPIDGPVRSKEHSGEGTAGQTISYEMDVAEGTRLATFDLDSVDDTADLDLVVAHVNSAGAIDALWQSASASADEKVQINTPAAGTYLVQANVYSAPEKSKRAAFDLTGFAVPAGPTGTPLVSSPSTLDAQQGVETNIELSWEGLEHNAVYMGLVRYGDSSVNTLVTVSAGDAPCQAPGKPHDSEQGKPSHSGEQGQPAHSQLEPCKPGKTS